MAFIFTHKRKLTLLALDREMAYMAGINPDLYQLLLYIMLACALVLGIRVLGVILVSAILIIPVSTARLLSRSFKALTWLTVLVAEFTILAGVFLSFFLDLPTRRGDRADRQRPLFPGLYTVLPCSTTGGGTGFQGKRSSRQEEFRPEIFTSGFAVMILRKGNKMAPQEGLEPPTLWLTAICSAD